MDHCCQTYFLLINFMIVDPLEKMSVNVFFFMFLFVKFQNFECNGSNSYRSIWWRYRFSTICALENATKSKFMPSIFQHKSRYQTYFSAWINNILKVKGIFDNSCAATNLTTRMETNPSKDCVLYLFNKMVFP